MSRYFSSVGARRAPNIALLHPTEVLVVDPSPTNGPSPCIAALFVASEALARGFKATLLTNNSPDDSGDYGQVSAPELVVFVLHGGVGAIATASDRTPWDSLGGVVRAHREAGAHVVAFVAGAMPAVTAIFAQHGARPVFDIDRLFDGPDAGEQGANLVPSGLQGLVQLTPHERSVLFQLTEGYSAGEIARTMIVSLSTVRAHIRSILKKLEVNSQLAAVALAHGTYRRDQERLAI